MGLHSSIEKYILPNVPIFRKERTVKEVMAALHRHHHYDSVDYVYVTDSQDRLVGVCSIRDLLSNPKKQKLDSFMVRKVVGVTRHTEVDQVAHLALKHDLKTIPVVESRKLIGVISSGEVVSIVNKALREDIFHFAGIHKSHLDFESSMQVPWFQSVKGRLSWLLIGLFGAIVMAGYINLFEKTISQYLIVASFMPAIVYMSDAVGTQIQTLFVRDIAVLGKNLHLRQYFMQQITVSIVIALVISVMMFTAIFLLWKDALIAFVISFAAFLSLVFTSLTSFAITLLIKRFKFDPALGSGPVATIISDMTSVVIYFMIVALFL